MKQARKRKVPTRGIMNRGEADHLQSPRGFRVGSPVQTLLPGLLPDKDLMTYRNGRRALARLVTQAPRLDKLNYGRTDDEREAKEWLRMSCSCPF